MVRAHAEENTEERALLLPCPKRRKAPGEPFSYSPVTSPWILRYTCVMHPMETIFEENKGKLFSYLVRMTGDADVARDILQESFTRCMERYADREVAPALLFTIARNAFIDHLRRNSRYTGLKDEGRDTRADPEHALVTKDRCARVLAGFKRLSQDERDVLSMVVSSSLSYAEIADVMCLSVANIKVKVHRARLKLRDYLEE